MIKDPALFDLEAVQAELRALPTDHSRDMDARIIWACLGKPSERIYAVLRDLPTRPIIWNSSEKNGATHKKRVEAIRREGIEEEHIHLLIGGQYYLFNDTVIPEITGQMEHAMSFARRALPPEAKVWADTDGNASVTLGHDVYAVAMQENFTPARAIIETVLKTLISLKDYHVKAAAGEIPV